MGKRFAAFFCILTVLMGGVLLRIAYLGAAPGAATAAALQSQKVITLSKTRAGIFDRNLTPLVNKSLERRSAVFPDILDTGAIIKFTDRDSLAEVFSSREPSVLDLGGKIVEGEGIYNFSFPRRYAAETAAPHIIGYMNSGAGVSGIEKAYDEFLQENGAEVSVRYYTDGAGRLLLGEKVELTEEKPFEHAGVVLTIDEHAQLAAEAAILSTGAQKAAAVVLNCENGEIIAAASAPGFDPGNIAAALSDENSPFINRAFSSYSVGSTFKLVVTAAALEKGVSPERTYTCTGEIEVEGRIYKCHWQTGHGEIDMERALEISCNPYFISLALEVGGDTILETAKNMGLGSPTSFGEGFSSAAGKLPSAESLRSKTVLASFGFGQGELLATPLQLAAVAASIANGGYAVTPKLVLGTYDKEGNYTENPSYAKNPVMSEATAAAIREMMVSVVEEGSGNLAKPSAGGAGGKTASAQTGQFDKDGNEIIHAWFLGFYPAENPQYAIAVLAEGMNSGSDYAAPVFREICEKLE